MYIFYLLYLSLILCDPMDCSPPGSSVHGIFQSHVASLVAQLVKVCLQCSRLGFDPWVGNIPWRRDSLPTPVLLGFTDGSAGKESSCNVGDLGSIPGLGRSPGEENGNPLQHPCLENPMDGGA